MTKVLLLGWKKGLEKISLNKLLRAKAGLSLAESKLTVDKLLEGSQVTVQVADPKDAHDLVDQAQSLGAIARVSVESPV